MKRAILVLVMVALCAVLQPAKASAATYFLDFTVTGKGTCANDSWVLPGTVSWNTPAEAITGSIVETENGVTTYNTNFSAMFSGSGSFPGLIISNGTFSLTQPYNFTLTVKYSTPTLGIFSAWLFQGTCVGGVATGTASRLPLGAAEAPAGPQIPDGDLLKTITCTQYVFDSPGGNPVGENKVTEGQTFYVSPKSVKGADGRMWSQVFVSSYSNPWILTSCAK